jgi:hypothetical protein
MEQEQKDQFDIEKDVVNKRKRSSAHKSKAPLPFRIIAWISLVVVCFGLGYGGTSLVLGILGEKKVVVQKDIASTPEGAETILKGEIPGENGVGIKAKKVIFNIYVPSAQGISSRQLPVISGLMEDDVRSVFSGWVSDGACFFGKDVRLLHVFRTGEIMYLDMNGVFLDAVRGMGKERAALAMTSIVRTVVENFSPVTKIRIMVDGQVPMGSDPIDLSVPWQLASS